MTTLPDWTRPPRAEGWYAEDLDGPPGALRHTELVDGVLVFRVSPQRRWHGRMVTALTNALVDSAPEGVEVDREFTIRLDQRNRPEPDIVVNTKPVADDQTWVEPSDVLLVVEVVSPESEHRDTTVKPRKYAEAGIPHYWIVEYGASGPVVHVYELDRVTSTYAPAGIFRERLERPVPFPVDLQLSNLLRRS
ncbi:Uma2 family endonuclease [Crossiella equi]|uniref:Uma2 family endonuclease n=1 Tax=Crossiella equi TaxID=130796 RepID=UPI000A363546|nr:Uma2 family endonuclease [Crossiella equi]